MVQIMVEASCDCLKRVQELEQRLARAASRASFESVVSAPPPGLTPIAKLYSEDEGEFVHADDAWHDGARASVRPTRERGHGGRERSCVSFVAAPCLGTWRAAVFGFLSCVLGSWAGTGRGQAGSRAGFRRGEPAARGEPATVCPETPGAAGAEATGAGPGTTGPARSGAAAPATARGQWR